MAQILDCLDDDSLILIFAALTIPDIQALRQVCRRLWFISIQSIVWQNACKTYILQEHIPFPTESLTSLSAKELERQTIRAYHLGQNWRSPNIQLRRLRTAVSHTGIIEEIKFVSKGGKNWVVTISLGIWSSLYIWDSTTLQIVGQWSPGKAVFNGMAINTDQNSDATVAISVRHSSYTVIKLLSLDFEGSAAPGVSLRLIATLQTGHKPITLRGDNISLSDHDSETIIMNWKTGEQCLLRSPATWQDNPLHATFVAGNIIVVRARSVCVFTEPSMVSSSHEVPVNLPHTYLSLGWVDGISMSEQPILQYAENPYASPLSMLVRTKGDDPWSLQDQFRFYTVHSSAGTELADSVQEEVPLGTRPRAPALTLTTTISCPNRGPLRCSDIVLGRYGTAVWVLPADRSAAGLISEHVHLQRVPVPTSNQTLTIASFPGPLHCGSDEAQIRVSIENEDGSSWSCMDYDEERGLIVLGSSTGGISLFSL